MHFNLNLRHFSPSSYFIQCKSFSTLLFLEKREKRKNAHKVSKKLLTKNYGNGNSFIRIFHYFQLHFIASAKYTEFFQQPEAQYAQETSPTLYFLIFFFRLYILSASFPTMQCNTHARSGSISSTTRQQGLK